MNNNLYIVGWLRKGTFFLNVNYFEIRHEKVR